MVSGQLCKQRYTDLFETIPQVAVPHSKGTENGSWTYTNQEPHRPSITLPRYVKESTSSRGVAFTWKLTDFDRVTRDDGGTLVVIDFCASWCGQCRDINPKLEVLSDSPDYSDVLFYKVDIDDNGETAAICNVFDMPVFQLYKHGKKIGEVVGSIESLTQAIQNNR